DKSRTAWELATHLATTDVWFLDSVLNGAFAWDPEAGKKAEASFRSVADVVAYYEKTFPAKIDAVLAMPGKDLAKTIDFFGFMQGPAVGFMGMGNNHGIHHRGQLAAYLRAMGSKVPAIYGGSADEPMAGM
ncbi:MAG: DinB family protein, partial [Gemmatimonadales bacterium]